MGGSARQSDEDSRSQGCVLEDHGHELGRSLQHPTAARLERRVGAGTEAAAGSHSPEPPLDDQPVAATLAQDQAGHGGVGHSEFQSAHVRSARHGATASALRDHPHRLRGLSAAFLDRAAPGAALHLRHAEGGGPSARDGLRGQPSTRHVRHDHSSRLLRGVVASIGARSSKSSTSIPIGRPVW